MSSFLLKVLLNLKIKNHKLGISNYWYVSSNSNNILLQTFIRNVVANIFLKARIIISDVLYLEYPKYIQLTFILYPYKSKSLNFITNLKKFTESLLTLLTGKNVLISFRLERNFINNSKIFLNWINLKVFHKPLKIKSTLRALRGVRVRI